MALGETEVVKTRLSLGQIVLSDTLSPKTMREPSPKRSRRSPLDKSENSQLESNAQSPPGRQEGKGCAEMAETPGTPMTDEMTGISCISSTATRHVDGRAAAEAAATLTDHETLFSMPLTVVIFGATGDLARKKLFPSLYKLCVQGHLPRHLSIVGYGRREVELNEFLAKQCVNVLEDSSWALSEFYARISFHAGGYDAPSSYEALDATIHTYEAAHPSKRAGNRLFFMSVPPTVFGSVATMIAEHSRAPAGGFTRLMIEKPFGRDSASFEALNQLTARHFDETQLFRIDHYLGKEIILNISTLRWANAIFEPLWSREHIETVQITFKENLGTDGRGGYFDGFGIVRDIIQNHLLQVKNSSSLSLPKCRTPTFAICRRFNAKNSPRQPPTNHSPPPPKIVSHPSPPPPHMPHPVWRRAPPVRIGYSNRHTRRRSCSSPWSRRTSCRPRRSSSPRWLCSRRSRL